MSVCVSECLSLSLSLSVCLSVFLSLCMSVCLCMFVCLLMCVVFKCNMHSEYHFLASKSKALNLSLITEPLNLGILQMDYLCIQKNCNRPPKTIPKQNPIDAFSWVAFTACSCAFKVITLVWANQRNYFENATACSKRTLKTTVTTQLKFPDWETLPSIK